MNIKDLNYFDIPVEDIEFISFDNHTKAQDNHQIDSKLSQTPLGQGIYFNIISDSNQIVDFTIQDDPLYDLLLEESNWSNIQTALLKEDPQKIYFRLAKLLNQAILLSDQFLPNYQNKKEQDFIKLLTLFFENYYHVQHSTLSDAAKLEVNIRIDLNQSNLNTILTNFTKAKNSKDILIRLIAFYLTNNNPYIYNITPDQVIECILNQYNSQAWMEKHQLISLIYLTNSSNIQNNQLFNDLIKDQAESFIRYLLIPYQINLRILQKQSNQNQMSEIIRKCKLLNLLATLSTQLSQMFYNSQFHVQIYHQLQLLSPLLGKNPYWSKEESLIKNMIGIIKGICQNNNIDELFAKKIADNFLFLVQKKSGCYFFFKVLPELFNILDKKYEIICDHQEIGEDCSEPQFRIGGKKKDKNNELHIEFHSEDLSEFEMNTINKNLDESTKQATQNNEKVEDMREWNKKLEYTMDNSDFSYEKFKQCIQKMKNVLISLNVTGPYGMIKIVIFTCDQFVKIASNQLTPEEQVYGGDIYVSRANDKAWFYVFDIDEKNHKEVCSVARKNNKNYPNNMKPFVQLTPICLKVYLEGNIIINYNFQDPNLTKFEIANFPDIDSLKYLNPNDFILVSGEVWVLEVPEYIKEGQKNANVTFELDQQEQILQNQIREVTMNYYLEDTYLLPNSYQLELKQLGFTNNIRDIVIQKEDFQIKELNNSFVNKIIDQNLIHDLIVELSLENNNLQRPNVTIFLFDCYTLLQIKEWHYHVIQQFHGQWTTLLTRIGILPIDQDDQTPTYFHQSVQGAYAALAKCKNIQYEGQLKELLFNRLQQYYPQEVNFKLTEEQKELKLKKLEEEKEKQKKKKIQSTNDPKSKKPKGIGYGDVSNTGLIFNSENQKKTKKSSVNAYESDQIYGNLANNQRWAILASLIQSITPYFNNKRFDMDQHKYLKFSCIPAIQYNMFKNFNISEILQDEKIQAFTNIIQLTSKMSSIIEIGDLFVDLDYGGKDSDCTIFEAIQALTEQAQFYAETFNQKKIESNLNLTKQKTEKEIEQELFKEKQEKKKQKIASQFIQNLQTMLQFLDKNLQHGQYLSVSYQQVQDQNFSSSSSQQMNISQFYQSIMKSLVIGSCPIIDEKGFLQHMNNYINSSSSVPAQTKMTRLVQEYTDIGQALPVEATNSIFVRYDSTRMDAMRTIIFGASGTPYAHGAFLYNFFFADDYPSRPPKCQLETTGHGKVRFNPNLYNCGKVCLSLLGTWGDNWIPNVSTLLQILISIQAMVMSEYVYFNEPGWEHSMGTPEGDSRNRGYCNVVKLANIRYAMIEAIREPAKGFEEIIHKSFYLRKDLILKEVKSWIDEADLPTDYSGTQNSHISAPFQADYGKYKVVLKAEIAELEKELEKLKLKISGSMNFSQESKEKKKITKVNYNRLSTLYSKEIRKKAQEQKKKEVQQLFESPLQQVDVSYDEKLIKKAFNINSAEIQSLMSRYIGVMGIESVAKQSQASVFLYGLSPTGVEVAKNLVLSGIKRLTIADVKQDQYSMIGQFYMQSNNDRIEQNVGKLMHLNPYVQIDAIPLETQAKDILKQQQSPYHVSNYNIVVICDYESYEDFQDIAAECRKQNIGVILGDQQSVYGRVIVDLGENFIIYDKDGEPNQEFKIDSISNEGIVELTKGSKHTLQDGDIIKFKEVVQESENKKDFNNQEFKVKVISRTQFSIGNIDEYNKFIRNGIALTQKSKAAISYKPIQQSLKVDGQFDQTMGLFFEQQQQIRRDIVQILFDGYDQYKQKRKKVPQTWDDIMDCYNLILNMQADWDQIYKKYEVQNIDQIWKNWKEQILAFCITVRGVFHPLSAYLGGLICQEIIKAITHKYMPINSIYIHSCEDVLPFNYQDFSIEQAKQYYQKIQDQPDNKYKELQLILGSQLFSELQNMKLFMIGAGAIGCELLKNYAMLAIATGSDGRIIMTDPDVIEHSNLNRQFLFREKHIRKPKSMTAANAVIQMNPDLEGKITARLDKVYPGTESSLNIVTNALDNVQARLYVDSRCVQNSKPLIESGTLGPKGHVQVILPGLTESYGSKQDPQEDNDIPYCTLKMFPEETLHCLEWARDKFETIFFTKPQSYKSVLENLMNYQTLQTSQLETTLKILKRKPKSFIDCLTFARNKYQKFFHNAIMQLLEAYPLDHKDDKGKLFWSSPKRPPQINHFDAKDDIKLQFVLSAAILYSQIHQVSIEQELIKDKDRLIEIVDKIPVQEFQLEKSKLEQIQKQVKEQQQGQPQQEEKEEDENVLEQSSPNELVLQIIEHLSEYFSSNEDPENLEIKSIKPLDEKIMISPIVFEKDEDDNHHIEFIQAATNCRAHNYKLEHMDWLQVKLKAGRIVPAMATTTACISALQTIEVVKVIKKTRLEDQKNSFLNLAVPFLMQSEPGECEKEKIDENLKISFWTRWEIQLEDDSESLQEIIDKIEQKYNVKVTAINQGAKGVYLPLMFVGKDENEKSEYMRKGILNYVSYQDYDEYVELDLSVEYNCKIVKNPPKVRLML